MWKDYKEKKDEIYENILTRAKDALPEYKVSDNRFVIPKADSQIQGNRTFFRNFKEILNLINRPETHFYKFMTSELGTAGSIQGGQAIFQGKHAKIQVGKLLTRYINDYVLCPECGKPDTQFIMQGRTQRLKCDACGAYSSIRTVS